MIHAQRKGLQDIATRSSLAAETDNPQRKFLRLASLELKKMLCRKVRDAARHRAEQMDGKIVELDTEQIGLLSKGQAAKSAPVAGTGPAEPAGATARRPFWLKY